MRSRCVAQRHGEEGEDWVIACCVGELRGYLLHLSCRYLRAPKRNPSETVEEQPVSVGVDCTGEEESNASPVSRLVSLRGRLNCPFL